MKLRILSDLHLEFGMLEVTALPDDNETVLVLAGDIFTGMKAFDFVTKLCKRFKDVIYVMGNHEFYNHDITTILENWLFIAKDIDNLHVLENDYVILDGVKIVGGTMWTDLNKGDWFAVQKAQQGMNDFRVIAGFTARASIARHDEFRDFLGRVLRWNEVDDYDKIVVVTHHLPIMDCVAPQFETSPLNPAFACTDMEELIADHNIALWVYGHTHHHSDFTKHGTRFFCNPRGYKGYERCAEEYNQERIVNV